MAENKAKDILAAVPVPVWLGLFGLLAAGSVWGDAKKAAEKLGKETGEAMKEVERSKAWLLDLPEFKAGYIQRNFAGKKIKGFDAASQERLANDLHSVKGFFNDNEEKLFTVLQKIRYKTQLAQVAAKFLSLYDTNLGAYLVSFTNTNERHRIEKIINEMESGIV